MKSSLLTRVLCGRQISISNIVQSSSATKTQPRRTAQLQAKKPALPTLKYIEEYFESVPPEKRNKEAFQTAIAVFQKKKTHVRGHVEFIYSALKRLEEYGLHKDLDTYKGLLDVFPKGALIPRNTFQRIFLHYPMQQFCCVRVLDQMEWHGVQPDREIHDIVANAFGDWNFATKKIKRMLYWMPKLKYSNKYLDRREIEFRKLSSVDLAFAALKMICRDPGTQFSYVKIKDVEVSEKEHWIVSGQSPLQKLMIERLSPKSTIYVDGPYLVYVMDHRVFYVVLTADPNPARHFDNFRPEEEEDDNFENWRSPWEGGEPPRLEENIHEQKDETILGLAVFGKADRKWAAAWINHLVEHNPSMRSARVLIRLKEEKTDLSVSATTDLDTSESFESKPEEPR